MGDYVFSDADFVKSLYAGDRTVFEKVYDEVQYLSRVVSAGSKEGRQLEKVKKAFADAYRVESKTQKNTADGGVKYSISETTDGRFVAVVDNDILKGIDTKKWDKETKKAVKKAADGALREYTSGFEINGVKYIDSSKTRREFTRSNYSEALARKNPTAYLNKMRSASVLDDVIHVSSGWTSDGNLKYDRDDFVDFIRGNTLISSNGNNYSAVVLAGITKDGEAIFYDIEDIRPASFKMKEP